MHAFRGRPSQARPHRHTQQQRRSRELLLLSASDTTMGAQGARNAATFGGQLRANRVPFEMIGLVAILFQDGVFAPDGMSPPICSAATDDERILLREQPRSVDPGVVEDRQVTPGVLSPGAWACGAVAYDCLQQWVSGTRPPQRPTPSAQSHRGLLEMRPDRWRCHPSEASAAAVPFVLQI